MIKDILSSIVTGFAIAIFIMVFVKPIGVILIGSVILGALYILGYSTMEIIKAIKEKKK